MRVTIIRDDNTVMIDGRPATVDCSSMLSNYHAVQWNDDHGEIETVRGDNIHITSLDSFQAILNAAQAKLKADEAAALEGEAEA